MNTPTITTLQLPARLQPLAAMGVLLERLERLPRNASADQYREVVLKAQQLLAAAEAGPALQALLDAMPALAELYENLHYAEAGLCRHALDQALPAELGARETLQKLRAGC